MTFEELMGCHKGNLRVFEELTERMKRGVIVPFIGAGMSAGIYPTWRVLIEGLANEYGLTEEIDNLLQDGKYEEAASVIEQEMVRHTFLRELCRRFDVEKIKNIDLPERFRMIPRIWEGNIITTNFDKVLEEAFLQETHTSIGSIVPHSARELARTNQAAQQGSQLLIKLHGDISDFTNLVLTKEEYNSIYGQDEVDLSLPMPSILKNLVTARMMLFLGCSLSKDRTLQVIKECTNSDHYALVELPKETENDENPLVPKLKLQNGSFIPKFNEKRKYLAEHNINCIWYPYGIHDAVEALLTKLESLFNPQAPSDFIITNNDTKVDTIVSRRFQGREDELEKLRKYINSGKKAILISGMGGIGKTEICKKLYEEFINKHKANEPIAINRIAFLRYEDNIDSTLVNTLLTSLTDTQEENIKQAWQQLKRISDSNKLLLIIDNVNKTINQDLSLIKLNSLSCSIILTSRNESFGEFIPIKINKMSYEECKDLFISIYKEESNEEVLDQEYSDLEYVIEKLAGRHTLTVKMFACIAKDHSWTITELKEKLEIKSFDLYYLNDGQEEKLIEEYKKLFELTNLNDEEINILEAFSVLPYYMLPIKICTEWMSGDSKSNSADLLINGICRKGWLEMETRQFTMHPVISEVIRAIRKPCLKDHVNLVQKCTQSMNIDVTVIRTQEFPYWFLAESIIRNLFDENSIEIAMLSMKTGNLFYNFADYAKALVFYNKTLAISEKVLGVEHPDTGTAYNNVALVYHVQGDYERALVFYNKALDINEKVLGVGHPSTAATYNNIAGVYQDKGDYEKALVFYNKALAISEKVLGVEHLDTATTYNNIAGVYQDKGDYEKSLVFYNKAMPIREKVLGVEHPFTAQTYNNIASVYQNKGDYGQALIFYNKAMSIREKVLGVEHPSTAATYNNIAGIYHAQGDYGQALIFYNKAMSISEKVLGAEHLSTAATYNNIASVYHAQGDYGKALEFHNKDLVISEKVLGVMHPHTATAYDNIAGVYQDKGDYEKALVFYNKAMPIREKVLGVEHPFTAQTYNNIASVYQAKGDYQKALIFYNKAMSIREKVLGVEHPSTAETYNNIAGVYQAQGDYEKSLKFYNKALSIIQRALGAEHSKIASTYNNIAGVYQAQGHYKKALEFYKKDLAISEKVLGVMHPDTATSYNNMAGVYQAQGDYEKSLKFYNLAISIREKGLGVEHPDTATSYNNIAIVYRVQGDYEKALVFYNKALSIIQRVLGAEHSKIASTYNNIAGVYQAQEDYEKALVFYNKALAISEKVLGVEHPSIASTYSNIAFAYQAQGDYEKALEFYIKSFCILFKRFGVNHQNTKVIKKNMKSAYIAAEGVETEFEQWLVHKMN